MSKNLFLACLLIGQLFAGSTVTLAAEEAKEAYRFAVFPYLPPREIEKIYSQVAKDFSRILNHPVIFKTSSSYESFMDAMVSEQFEFAFVQPFDYVDLADKHGYRPLAAREKQLRGVVVVADDSPMKSMKDLRGKVLAMTPKSAAVSYLVFDELERQGLKVGKDIQVKHFLSHVSCLQQLKIRKADACSTAMPAVNFFQDKMKIKLREIGKTKAVPHSLFVANPSVPIDKRELIQKRILEWGRTEEGKQFMEGFRLALFKKIDDSAYDVVRAIKRKL
ncbi:MAG: phosphate/phosphite/phosphonate ABC transporter substrate-binding protein [Gammaproteobacteria bacterium]|nr:phosphate/phosphite/phosphonate ABC transporter substrate-binding protein [Gammaproteobacteria bacterium]